ncbi:MAG: hypothetical protein A2138_20680 [Deltaproteobacteria bacterium RBG_16_71_12]|nr:MAG: hypothetical protein A2138_20680 [Deltaproteobacteria bacterium RBG_16_71_12]
MNVESTRAVLGALERHGVHYVVFGGVALNLHGLARFTEDLDVFIEPTADNIARLRAALHSVYRDPHIDEITEADLLGDYPAIQYIPPDGSFHLDILTRLGEAFAFADIEAERVPFFDITVAVATPRTLYRMKRGTVRPKDWSDASALKRQFALEEDD